MSWNIEATVAEAEATVAEAEAAVAAAAAAEAETEAEADIETVPKVEAKHLRRRPRLTRNRKYTCTAEYEACTNVSVLYY